MDLKKNLDEYLLLQSDTKKNFSIPGLSTNRITSFFSRSQSTDGNDGDSWFQETQKSWFPTMSRIQRIMCFLFCLAMGFICFSLSAVYIPVLIFKARKFAMLFTLGSLFLILSVAFLWGPAAYFQGMFKRERLGLTISYGGTLLLTLYFAMFVQSTPLTVVFAVGQIITLLWSLGAAIPGGATGVKFFSKVVSTSVSQNLPV